MTFDIEQRPVQFHDVAKEMDAIAAELQVSEQIGGWKINTGERQLRSLTENGPHNIARWDTAGTRLYVNTIHERTLRVRAAELISTGAPDAYNHVVVAIVNVAATEEALPFVRLEVHDGLGDVRIHDINLNPEGDVESAIGNVLRIGRDMTKLVQMQEALATSDRPFRTLEENLPNCLARYTPDARVTYIIPRLESLIGYGPDEVGVSSAGQNLPEQQVVAEGVETAAPAAFLEANDCQLMQGCLYGKPLPKLEMVFLPRRLELDPVADRNVDGRNREALHSYSQPTWKCPPVDGND